MDVVKSEFDLIISFFSLFSNEKLYHCIIANQIAKLTKLIGDYPLDILTPFLNTAKYQIYSTLLLNDLDDTSGTLGTTEQKKRVSELVKNYTDNEINCLIQVCVESSQTFIGDEFKLKAGLEYIFEVLSNRNQLYLHLVDIYMKADTPYNISAERILQSLFKIMSPLQIKKYITQYKYNQQNLWLWYYYVEMPIEQISAEIKIDLLKYLETPDSEQHPIS